MDMRLPLFQLDAFCSRLFAGNPAAVCPLENWLPDDLLQAIAAENNLSETAFLVPHRGPEGELPGGSDEFELRWFTPKLEVDLCGHATLASGVVVLQHLRPDLDVARFRTRSGPLEVRRRQERWSLDLPRDEPQAWDITAGLSEALGAAPLEVARGEHYGLALLADEDVLRNLSPDMGRLARLEPLGIIATTATDMPGVDFLSRFFAPRAGVSEDPVTGSAHCLLTPFWSQRLGQHSLEARQISPRGGALSCHLNKDRVRLEGSVVPYLEGWIEVPDAPRF